MTGAGGAFNLAALQLVGGTLLLLLDSLVFSRAVDRGHYRAATWVLFPLTIGLAFLFPPSVRISVLLTGLLMGLFVAALYSQRPLLEWIAAGIAGAGALRAVFLAFGIQGLAGAFFLGSVTHGMTLGHWYLNQPRLPIEPLKRATALVFAGCAVALAGGIAARERSLEGEIPGAILRVSPEGYWLAWLAMVLAVVVLGVMIRSTVWSRSTQSATGLLYIAMIPAIGAQFVLNLLLLT